MGARILVVDDSNTIRRVVCGILERHGFEPEGASDGQRAVEMLTSAEQPYELVLLDFVMPKMNGFQFCRAIRSREEWKRLPVLLMSAKTDRIREQFVQQTGALDAITKPFDAQALVAVVENALKRVAQGQVAVVPPLVLDENDVPLSTRPPAVREEHAIRARATADFAAQLGNVLAPLVAKLPADVHGDEGRILEALAAKIGPDEIGRLGRALRGVDLTDKQSVVLVGNLGAIPIGAILQLLQMEAQTGMLAIWNAESEITVHMRGGLVDLVQSRGAGDEFRLGRFFLEEGLVTEEQLDAMVRSSQRPGPPSSEGSAPSKRPSKPPLRLLGDLLVEAGHVTEAQLKNALTRQSSELIYEVLRWHAGQFEFRQRATSAIAERARLAMPVASVVMEGFRRVDEWRVIEARLGSFDQVLLPDPASVDSMGGDTKLSRAEQAVLEAIDGERTVREVIAASHLSSFDACRILFQLIEARLVRRQAA
jgi:DNA-binding response OmpR family regulator